MMNNWCSPPPNVDISPQANALRILVGSCSATATVIANNYNQTQKKLEKNRAGRRRLLDPSFLQRNQTD